MALFVSTYENKVDGKGRVSVPASFRNAASAAGFDGIVLFSSPTLPCVEGADLAFLEQFSDHLYDEYGAFADEDLLEAGVAILSTARELSFDPNGRVVLPQDVKEATGISDKAVFVGMGKKFQLWSADVYAEHRAARLKSGVAAAAKLPGFAGRKERG